MSESTATEFKITFSDDVGELQEALNSAQALFKPFASKGIARSLTAISREIEPYPPQPDRMRSGRLNTYVRGQGRYPKSAFVPDVREPGGFAIKKGVRAIKLTSQQMDKKYRHKVEVTDESAVGLLTNEATYSGWVVGPKEGDPHQVSFHAETGWVNADDAVEKAKPEILKYVSEAVEDFIEMLAE
jgi:hypothetical protein